MTRVSAEDRYRRLTAALDGLSELAAGPHGQAVARTLAGDDVILARMQAAADVIRGAGLAVCCDGSRAELLRAAVAWQRYAGGPVVPVHADCGRDLSRGLLRLWTRGAPPPADQRARLRAARMRLAGQVRAQCAALRTEVRQQPAPVGARRRGRLREDTEQRVRRVLNRLDAALRLEFADAGGQLGVPGPAPVPGLPPLPPVRLENRLTVLFGGGFGVGAALTLDRAGAVLPAAPGPLAVLSALAGAGLGGWVVRTRRQLSARAVLERWAAEVSAAVRAALDEHIAAELLAASGDIARAGFSTVPDQPCDPSDILAINSAVHCSVNLHSGLKS